MLTYKTVKQHLYRLIPKDFRMSLEPMREMADRLGNPQLAYKTIHVTGSNGKGSTVAFLESLLRAKGLRVGMMTSPHLQTVRERIQIDRKMISEKEFVVAYEAVRGVLPNKNYLTFFELTVLMGFWFFAKKKVDVAVIEVGLGGRWDATNIVLPTVGVFTPISLEHQRILGETLQAITQEKCGILKPGMQVVSAPQEEEVRKVIEENCRNLDLPLHRISPLKGDILLGLKGEHQKTNAAVALKGGELFLGRGEGMSEALVNTFWPGRLQYINQNPKILLDGAHNLAGIEVLVDFLRKNHGNDPIFFIFGVMRDKKWEKMIEILASLAKKFIFVAPKQERSLSIEDLSRYAQNRGILHETAKSFPQVVEKVFSEPKKGQLWVACGSLFVLGELLDSLKVKDQNSKP